MKNHKQPYLIDGQVYVVVIKDILLSVHRDRTISMNWMVELAYA